MGLIILGGKQTMEASDAEHNYGDAVRDLERSLDVFRDAIRKQIRKTGGEERRRGWAANRSEEERAPGIAQKCWAMIDKIKMKRETETR